jgi:hypothetical protein
MTQKALRFWKRHHQKGMLIGALRAHPKKGRAFFGALPAMRGNLQELVTIITAYEILMASPDDLTSEMLKFIEGTMSNNLNGLPESLRTRFLEIVSTNSKKTHDKARVIITNVQPKTTKKT